jgi:SAM-dependent methyltransferase
MNRNKKLTKKLNLKGLGLEIGPSHNPITPKKEGYNVHVMDYASRNDLLKKYKDHNIKHSNIEEVDYIWDSKTSYSNLINNKKHYDWIIASHVIEHTPNLIGFLQNCDDILKSDGILSLAIPDKRYCFDYFRPVSSIARIIDQHLSQHTTATPGAIAEQILYRGTKLGCDTWNSSAIGNINISEDVEVAKARMVEAINDEKYIDIHNWCFTPYHFRLLIHDLHALGFTEFKELEFKGTTGCEFFITLSRKGPGANISRESILKKSKKESTGKLEPLINPLSFFRFIAKALIRKF